MTSPPFDPNYDPKPEPIAAIDDVSPPAERPANRTPELRALALRVAEELAADLGAETILLTGSVARGEADAVSDVDLIVTVAELPSPEEQEAMKEAALASGGGIYGHDPERGLSLYRFVEGVKVDVGLGRTADTEARVEALSTEPDPEDGVGPIVATGILEGEPLRGAGRIRAWKERLAHLPAGYGETLVRHHLRFPPRAVLEEMGASRGDYALVYELLLGAAGHAQSLLCGLNDRWPMGKLKGLRQTVDALPIAPPDAGARFDALWTQPPEEAVRVWRGLAEDILDLVDAHMPAVDTSEARARMALALRRAEA